VIKPTAREGSSNTLPHIMVLSEGQNRKPAIRTKKNANRFLSYLNTSLELVFSLLRIQPQTPDLEFTFATSYICS